MMKALLSTFLLCLCVSTLVLAQTAPAATPTAPLVAPTTPATPTDICSPTVTKSLDDEAEIKLIRDTVQEAISTLDNAKITFSSPILAGGRVSYLTVSPNFADNISNICVVGFFEQGERDELYTAPLDIDHIEVVKIPDKADATKFSLSSRIFFRAPDLAEFNNAKHVDSFTKFWSKHQEVKLKFAAYEYKDGQRLKTYFGHSIPVGISYKNASIAAALVFSIFFYLMAAFTISHSINKNQEILPTSVSGFRLFFRKLSPWCIVGSSGQASLSQLQMLAFTLIVATLLFYQWMRTGVLQEISTDLLYLIGISTVGAGGNEIAKSVKKTLDTEVYAYVQQLGWFTAPMENAHTSAHPSELLLTNGRFDIYKFQMLLFTVVIAGYVIASGANELGNIQISATLLTLMGISQGVYVGGHAATDSLTPFQDQVRGMQALQQQFNEAENSQATQKMIADRFRVAATLAAKMFSDIYQREVPPKMLEMAVVFKTPPAIEKSALLD